MQNSETQFLDLIGRLKTLNLAYLYFLWKSHRDPATKSDNHIDLITTTWGNQSSIFICGWISPKKAAKIVDETFKDRNVAVVFGRYFNSNSDLLFRMKNGILLEEADKDDFYRAKSLIGYVDYEFSPE